MAGGYGGLPYNNLILARVKNRGNVAEMIKSGLIEQSNYKLGGRGY